jgi:hypothetical protein
MTDEEEVQLLILQAERQRDTLIAATKEQVANFQRLSDAAEYQEEKRRYLELAVETLRHTQEVLATTNRRIASVREHLERSTATKH